MESQLIQNLQQTWMLVFNESPLVISLNHYFSRLTNFEVTNIIPY
jgi:hypothetical protein